MSGEPVVGAAGSTDRVPPRPIRLSTSLTARQPEPGLANQRTTTPDAASPGQRAGKILKYHVVGRRYDTQRLVQVCTGNALDGAKVNIAGTPLAPTVTATAPAA
jgi:hypothetical protein